MTAPITSGKALLLLTLAGLLVSGIAPSDRFTWFLEVFPILVFLPLVVRMNQRIQLTPLTNTLLCLGALLMMVGAKYTYSDVPAGEWAKAVFGFERNHYDRFGHFFQGFVAAMFIREILLKRTRLLRSPILFVLVMACCLAISASYELLEWLVAVVFGSNSTEFIGTQGDEWDTQWDMFLATTGAFTAQLCLSGVQDGQLSRVP